MRKVFKLVSLIILSIPLLTSAQDNRSQYPFGLRNAHFGVNIGYINYPFSFEQMEPGFTARSVSIPHPAVRILLYGASLNKYLSANVTYMRPVNWVTYKGLNGENLSKTVWTNIAGLTLNGNIPIAKRFSFTTEAGLAIITRNGFEINYQPVIKHANYGTGIFGAGVQYHLNKKWDLQLGGVWSPPNKKYRQPQTVFIGAGFNYTLSPLDEKRIELVKKIGAGFPKQVVMAGFTTNALGYGVNTALSKGPVPVFWGGDARVENGFSVSYQRNIFHTARVFAFDWAAHAGIWKSNIKHETVFTISLNPVLRFTAIRSSKADYFIEYSVAGPSFISKTKVDDVELGRKFTFHDFMGIGLFAGRTRQTYIGLRIAHYSNGNLFPQNDGMMVPLTLNLGRTF